MLLLLLLLRTVLHILRKKVKLEKYVVHIHIHVCVCVHSVTTDSPALENIPCSLIDYVIWYKYNS